MAHKHVPLPRFVFDIETVGIPEARQYMPEFEAPKNYKDEEKIQRAIEEQEEEFLAKAGLDSDLGQVRLIAGRMLFDGPDQIVLIPQKRMTKKRKEELTNYPQEELGFEFTQLHIMDESKALEWFWGQMILCNGCAIGYNILGFDIPFLMKRSMLLGVMPGMSLNLAKYRTEPITDLMPILANWQWGGNKKLKWIADRYGLEVLAEETDGSMVEEMSDEDLILYGLSDLWITEQLYKLMNGIYFNHLTPAED